MKNADLKYLALVTFFSVLTFPFINFLAVNYAELNTHRLFLIFSFISITAVSVIVIGAVSLIRIERISVSRTLAVFSCALVLFFLFGPITSQISSLGELLSLTHGVAATYVLFCMVCIAAVYWMANRKIFHVSTAIFFVSLVSLSLVRIVYSWAIQVPESSKTTAVLVDAPLLSSKIAENTKKRNIYYVIVDAYPRHDMARTHLSYLNTIESELEKRGFHNIKEAKSSYFSTYFTLASIFHGGYQVTGRSPTDLRQNEFGKTTYYPEMLDGDVEPNLVSAVKRLGYDFYVVGNAWAKCRDRYVRCFAFESDLYFVQNAMPYEIRLFIDSTPVPLLLTYLDPLMILLHDKWTSSEALRTELAARNADAIPRIIARIKSGEMPPGPYFMFLHNISPHPPFRYNADCSLRKNFKFDFTNWSERAKKDFVINIECTNRLLIEFADLLEKADPDAIIVFQSDHGTAFTVDWHKPPALWSEEAVRERISIFNLIRGPKECDQWIQSDLNNVNTVRFVLGCMTGQQPIYIRNDSYIGQYYRQMGPSDSNELRLVR